MAGLVEALELGDAAPARLRTLLAQELARGEQELTKPRSGYGDPVVLAFGHTAQGALVAALPVPAEFRADAAAIEDRAWRVVAAAVGALAQSCDLPSPAAAGDLHISAGLTGDGRL